MAIRGNYDASSNLFPNTGGTGSNGAILAGNTWYISVSGTLSGVFVGIGASIRALTNEPGQTLTNWRINHPLKARILIRSDTSAKWIEKNPILGYGEIAITQDANLLPKIKIGDGKKLWAVLDYLFEPEPNIYLAGDNVTIVGNVISVPGLSNIPVYSAGDNVTIVGNVISASTGLKGTVGGNDNNLLRASVGVNAEVQSSSVSVDDNGAIHGYAAKQITFSGVTATIDAASVPSGSVVRFTNASAVTATISSTIPPGWCCTCVQIGSGQVTFSVTGGALLNRQNHTRTFSQIAMVTLYCDSNTGTSPQVYMQGDTA